MKRSKQRPDGEPGEAEANAGELRDCALRLLTRREHSSFELRQKLAARGFPDANVEALLLTLAREGLQSDARFASGYAQGRAARGYGPLRIREELRQRGVAAELVEEQLQEGDWDWVEMAEAVRRKKFGRAVPTVWAERARQARFLQYRGFGSEHMQRLFSAHEHGSW